MRRRINRVAPALPAKAMKTYSVVRPGTPSYWRPASCEEIGCEQARDGWQVPVAAVTEQHYRDLLAGGWRWTRVDLPGGGYLDFPGGQRCLAFSQHRIAVEREPLYVVRDGDWRGNPRGTRPRYHRSGRDWVDDFGEHQATLADRLAQG